MIDFLFPAYLWLLLLIPLLWIFTFAIQPATVLGNRQRWRFWGSLLIRTASLTALIFALASTRFIQPVDNLNVIFLLDGSDSVGISQRARAETYIQQALTELPPTDQAGIIVFGERAAVERPPSAEQRLGQLTQVPNGTHTNIQDAIQLGVALLPAEAQRRLVLISDGGENSGDAQAAARLAAAQGIPIDIVSLSGQLDGFDAQISGLELPATVGVGQSLRLAVNIESRGPPETSPVAARLVVEQRQGMGGAQVDQALIDQELELTGEPQRFEFTLPSPEADFNRYVVQLRVADDVRQENNVAEAFTLVEGRPRVLLVEGTPDAARNLQQALDAADLTIERTTADQVPASLSALVAYDAVILVDVAERDLDQRVIDILPAYVRDMGRGLAMVGGPQSFGVGGWRDTPVETALPVDMELRPEVRQPPVSIVVVIDVSGSMGQTADNDNLTKVELAAAGAASIAAQLRDEDEITVLPFDDAARNVVGPLAGTERERAIERIRTIDAGGGGINIHDALQAAARITRSSEKPVRHIITITDGDDTVQQEGARELVDELRAEGVTVTSIAVGDGKDVAFLEDIVQRGQGRFFLTREARDVPAIMTDEAQSMIEPLLIEGAFVPTRLSIHPILRDIDSAPSLYGYVATTPKDSAQVLLAAENDDPVLAVWQYGLGRSLAWTSDMRGQWASEWVQWPEFQRLASQMVVWLLPPADAEQRLTFATQTLGNELMLLAEAQTETGEPMTGWQVSGQMVASDNQAIDVALREVMPGRYRLAMDDVPPGVYMVQLQATDSQGAVQASVIGGASVPFSREYGTFNDNPALLNALRTTTGGRSDPDPGAVFAETGQQTGTVREAGMPLLWLALLLLPCDVAIRRLFGRRRMPGSQQKTATTPFSTPARPTEHRTPAVEVVKAAPPPAESIDPLERLRVAQERARRRARGEE